MTASDYLAWSDLCYLRDARLEAVRRGREIDAAFGPEIEIARRLRVKKRRRWLGGAVSALAGLFRR